MVEQTGSIFLSPKNVIIFIQSIFSDIFVRDKEFKNIGFNKKGMLQILSVLPTSYPEAQHSYRGFRNHTGRG